MKFFFTLFFALHFSFLSAQWQQLAAPGVVGYIDLAKSQNQLFAMTEFSLLHRSVSNGLSWDVTNAPVPLENYLHYVSMDADDNLLAVLIIGENDLTQVFQSTDFGVSWIELQGAPSTGGFNSGQLYVHNGVVFFFRDNQLYYFNNGSSTWDLIPSFSTNYSKSFTFKNNQIWMSTNQKVQYSTNLGVTWQDVVTPFNWAHSITADGNGIVAAAENFIYYTNDDGLNWQQRTLASNASMTVVSHDGISYASTPGQLFRSTDGFSTYTLILSGLGYVRDAYDITGFWVAGTSYGIYRSPQNPSDWQWIPSGISSPFARGLDAAGGVLFYTDSRTTFSTDEGDSWQVTNGLHRFYDFLYHNSTWYGLKYNEIWRSNNLTDWTLQVTAPIDSFIFWEYLGNTMVYCAVQDGNPVKFSNDDGATWQTNGSLPVGSSQLFAYNNQLYLHTFLSNKLLTSNDFGGTWTEVGNDVFAADPYIYNSLVHQGKMYAFTGQNNMLISTDGGLSWTVRSLLPINPQQNSLSGSIAFDGKLVLQPFNPGLGTLFMTQDDGVTWQPIMAGLTAVPRGNLASTGTNLFDLDEYSIPWRRDNFSVTVSQYSGFVYRDLSFNGQYDSGEPPLANTILHLTNTNLNTTTNSGGTFNMFAEAQNDILTAVSPGPYCTFNPPNYAINASNTQLDFGLNCPPVITDLAISLVNTPPFRPGFDTDIFLTARNLGNDAANGTVSLTLDPTVQFVSATPPATPSGNTLTWSFSAFQSLDQMNFVVRVNTPANTLLGTTLCNTAEITPGGATDQNPVDNTTSLCRAVIGSYDPNDKQVDKTAYPPTNPGSEPPLIYTVRFQNTGTYLASLVVIKDALSPNLDPATLQVLAASHPFTWSLHGNGIVEFRFDGINLPDMVSDEPGSHGFVQFSVKPKAGLPLGEMTQNTAYIYFDFNQPIITNTVTSTVVSTHEPVLVVQLSAMPNPAHETVRILFPKQEQPGILNLHLYDLSGQLMQVVRMEGNEARFDVRGLANGIYQVRGSDEKRIYVAKFEVMH